MFESGTNSFCGCNEFVEVLHSRLVQCKGNILNRLSFILHVKIASEDNIVIAILSSQWTSPTGLKCLKLQVSIHGLKWGTLISTSLIERTFGVAVKGQVFSTASCNFRLFKILKSLKHLRCERNVAPSIMLVMPQLC